MAGLALLAPLFLAFEIWQLVMGERYVGIRQIARGADPREMGPGELVSAVWAVALLLYGLWMVALLTVPPARVHALCLLAATAVGYSVRRNCGLHWILVTLTFEGSVRIGFLLALSVRAWRHFPSFPG